MKQAIAGAILRAIVAGADRGCAGALRLLRGAESALHAIEAGFRPSGVRKIPSLQGFNTRARG